MGNDSINTMTFDWVQEFIDNIVDLYQIPVMVAEFLFCMPPWMTFLVGLSVCLTVVKIIIGIVTTGD